VSQITTSQQSSPLGAKTATVLATMFQDVYRQEVGAEEDVHRTLPFFATALGFVIAAINYTVGQLPSLEALARALPTATGGILNHHVLARGWPVVLATFFLIFAAALGIAVLGFLAAATKRQNYRRVGPETAQLARAEALQAYHAQRGLVDTELDDAVSTDLRQQLLNDYADVIPSNRQLTLQRYTHRARAVSCLLLSLLFALLATTFVLLTGKTGFFLPIAS
jgi:hypothetical protein